jgi:hypothetical protein
MASPDEIARLARAGLNGLGAEWHPAPRIELDELPHRLRKIAPELDLWRQKQNQKLKAWNDSANNTISNLARKIRG